MNCYEPDAVIETGDGHRLAQGHDAIRARFERVFADCPRLHVERVERFCVADYVVQLEAVRGRSPALERQIAIYDISLNGNILRERLLR